MQEEGGVDRLCPSNKSQVPDGLVLSAGMTCTVIVNPEVNR